MLLYYFIVITQNCVQYIFYHLLDVLRCIFNVKLSSAKISMRLYNYVQFAIKT